MIIRHLKIVNFRGIRALDWHLSGRVVCLIGPNDATKTTLLDAIEWVSLPRSNFQVTDSDFYQSDTSNPILIEATIGELPAELLVEPEKYGLCLRGYHPVTGLSDDPVDGTEPVLTVRFEAGADLDASWTVIKASLPEPKRIGWQDRERLGVTRLGEDVEKHLTWARGSALSKLTAKNTTTAQTFAKVTREARKIVAAAKLDELNTAAAAAQASATNYGAGFGGLKPGLDAAGFPFGASVLALHDAAVPLRLSGLGTKRLAALAIQQTGMGKNSISLIDELEHGLEPHRIRLLLERISREEDGADRKVGQVIFTTHSPTTVMALKVTELAFVRVHKDKTVVERVKPESVDTLQAVARSHGHAFLGRKLVICEGATEVGLCWGMTSAWTKAHGNRPPGLFGAVFLDGKGCTVAPSVALELHRVGYDVRVLADSDVPLNPTAAALAAQGVKVIQWDGGVATEERLAQDLPLPALQELIDIAMGQFGSATVLSQVSQFGGFNVTAAGDKISGWFSAAISEGAVRSAIGKAAKKGKIGGGEGWFKNVTVGQEIGRLVGRTIDQIPATPLAHRLAEVAAWIYG